MSHNWIYFWGKVERKEDFFHLASFKNEGRNYIHFAFKGQFYEEEKGMTCLWQRSSFSTSNARLKVLIRGEKVIHFPYFDYYYYSFPFLKGYLYYQDKKYPIDFWLDHEIISTYPPKNWEWLGVKLKDEKALIVYSREKDSFAKIIHKSGAEGSKFDLSPNRLVMEDLGLEFEIQPVQPENIFHPTQGRPYSEQPIHLLYKGEMVGYGMRERTHLEE